MQTDDGPARPVWCTALGVGLAAMEAEIRAAYRRQAVSAHPNQGRTNEEMRALNAARDEAVKAIRRRRG